MTRTSFFDNPLLLGFDHLERMLERIDASGGDGYPPYDIVARGAGGYRITLAVAGFARSELGVTVADHQLTIRGKREDGADAPAYLHRGIAARRFQRSFLLADGLEVVGATLESGLLHIDLARPEPENRQRIVEIEDASGRAPGPEANHGSG